MKTRCTVVTLVLAALGTVSQSLAVRGNSSATAAATTLHSETPMASAADKPRDLDTHHLFTPPASRHAWEARKKELRRQVLFSAGLWPVPEKTPLHPQVTGRIDGPDYIIENVAIETQPGFYLCGNLYKPKGKRGPFPGIVNPHGHWEDGRLEIQADVPKAEPPPAAPAPGRGNLVSIGVNLARQGFVVFAYDAVGYNDTMQLGGHHEIANGLRPWVWGISLLGQQLWDSIRAVDYLQSLPEVDRNRIGATGASGGGSQTFLLTAVDDRIKVSVPVNMVSAYMQGGCLCENGPGLRVGTDNPEIAATFAPKPLLMVAATGDWTSKNPTEEWPAIKKVYDLYGAGDRTACKQFNYQHNYNVESREAMYAWFGRWLLNDPDPEHFRERPFAVDVKAMHVWNDQHPMPANALNQDAWLHSIMERSKTQIEALWPHDEASLKHFRETMQPALEASLATHSANIGRDSAGSRRKIALLVVGYGDERSAESANSALARAGYEVSTVGSVSPLDSKTLWDNFYSTYNRTPVGENVSHVVDAIGKAAANCDRVDMVGIGNAGPVCLLARALAPQFAGRTVADVSGIDLASDDLFLTKLYAPGLRGAGDLTTAAMLVAPSPLCLFNTGGGFKTDRIKTGFDAVHATLRVETGSLTPDQIVEWLKK